MSNSIDINLGRENNSMNSLTFHWFAMFNDGTVINQFDQEGKEHRFQEVKDKFSDLIFFNLTNNKDKFFTVDLKQGVVGCNNHPQSLNTESKETKKNIRLIFFRRRRKEIGCQDLKIKSESIKYHLGFQYNYEDGKNRQTILKIDEEGNFTIE